MLIELLYDYNLLYILRTTVSVTEIYTYIDFYVITTHTTRCRLQLHTLTSKIDTFDISRIAISNRESRSQSQSGTSHGGLKSYVSSSVFFANIIV